MGLGHYGRSSTLQIGKLKIVGVLTETYRPAICIARPLSRAPHVTASFPDMFCQPCDFLRQHCSSVDFLDHFLYSVRH